MFKVGISKLRTNCVILNHGRIYSRLDQTLSRYDLSQLSKKRSNFGFFTSRSNFSRTYATHRELYQRLSNRKNQENWWSKYSKPLAWTVGFLAFDYFVLPRIINLPFFSQIRQQPELLVYGIIGLNVAGFFAWRISGLPRQIIARFGLLQKQPQYFHGGQLLGMAFSHQNFWHLAINMFVLFQFGAPIANWLGATFFLQCYLDSCVLSSLGSILLPALLGRFSAIPSLGASGAVFSCIAIFSYLVPHARIALWFIPLPIGAWYVFLLTMGYNVVSMFSRRAAAFTGSGIDYAGHVAGSVAGIMYGWIAQKRINEKRRRARRIF